MTFQRLKHGPVAAHGAVHIINKAEEYLEDVHTFLKLPIPKLGISAGGNYSIALVLFEKIDGASKTLYSISPICVVTFQKSLISWVQPPGSKPGTLSS